MPIWFNKNITLSTLDDFGITGLAKLLDLKWMEIGDDFLRLRMPVNEKTKQAYGLLHGGASCVLAETVGSIASALTIDQEKYACVGLEINANHIRSATSGFVTAYCTPLHLGRSTHVWDIKIHDDLQKLVCVCRLTVVIIEKSKLSFTIHTGGGENIANERE